MMNRTILPIIEVHELLKLREKAEDFILIDVSYGPEARSAYDKNHLEGAIFADLDTQLSEIKEDPAEGGRHPLPSLEKFSDSLSQLGIGVDDHVILYDRNFGALAAARFWWMLRSVGHEKVQVLNGGYQEAVRAGYPVDDRPVKTESAPPYPVDQWILPMADVDEVELASRKQDQIIIDVRSSERYRGETEPIDLVAGHIPGAVNIPLTENLDQNQLFLSPKQLKEKYQPIFKEDDSSAVIVHCGSGVSACHTLLAMDYAGLEIPKLYVGSWSEWSRRDLPVSREV